MKFSDLEDFIANKMHPATRGDSQYNYQSIVIATLVQNNGTVTKKELQKQLQKHNPGSTLNDFSDCPAFKIIVRENIAKKDNANFEMLDFDTYTIEQKAKIIVDCILKIPEKKEYLEDSVDFIKYQISMQSELQSEKKEVLEKYGKVFSLKNIDKLTAKKYQSFLVYKNNYHWNNIQRDGGRVVKDMKELKNTLKILVDETIPVEERMKKMRTSKMTLGKSTFTPILLVASNMKHAVVNKIITGGDPDPGAFEQLGLTNEEQSKKLEEWEFYALVQKIIEYIAQIYDFDLWEIDWVWWDVNKKRNPGEQPNYWLLMPGKKENLKDKEWISADYAGVGYADLFLPRYFSRNGEPDNIRITELKQLVRKTLEDREKRKAKEQGISPKKITKQAVSKCIIPLGQFMEIAKNDVLILWNGTDKIFARSTVGKGHYHYTPEPRLPPWASGEKQWGDAGYFTHSRKVIWEADERDIPDGIHKIPAQGIFPLYGEEGRKNHEFFKWLMGVSSATVSTTSNDYEEETDILKWKKNLILYGPPGTGKTYHAGRMADEFLKDNTEPTWLICAARILTEHGGTPMPYKEITNLVLEENIRDASAAVTPKETVRRDISEDIENNTDSFFKQEARGSYGLNTPMTFIKGIRLILSCFGEQHYTEITKMLIDNNIVKSDGATPEKTLLAVITEDISRNGVNSTFVSTNTPGVYNLRNTKPLPVKGTKFKEKITFHQSYSYEEFMEGIKAEVVIGDDSDPSSIKRYVNYDTKPGIFKAFCSRAEDDLDNKYVYIIDEINRGNISKIFGELITVIEKDKRGTEVILPYSKLPFSVPENVYIIGTMNTADRSIALIDTALTRRFGRKEIMPDSSVLKDKNGNVSVVDGINLKELLDALNQKIYNIGMRERQLGHSYLMKGENGIDNIDDLRLAFVYDILPLLRELPVGEDEDLQSIIGTSLFIDWDTKNVKSELTKHLIEKGHNHANDAFKKEINDFMKWVQPDQELYNEEVPNTPNKNQDI